MKLPVPCNKPVEAAAASSEYGLREESILRGLAEFHKLRCPFGKNQVPRLGRAPLCARNALGSFAIPLFQESLLKKGPDSVIGREHGC